MGLNGLRGDHFFAGYCTRLRACYLADSIAMLEYSSNSIAIIVLGSQFNRYYSAHYSQFNRYYSAFCSQFNRYDTSFSLILSEFNCYGTSLWVLLYCEINRYGIHWRPYYLANSITMEILAALLFSEFNRYMVSGSVIHRIHLIVVVCVVFDF